MDKGVVVAAQLHLHRAPIFDRSPLSHRSIALLVPSGTKLARGMTTLRGM
jgi:hypothetical protein